MSTTPKPLPPPLPTVPVTTPLPDDGAVSKVSLPWLSFFQLLQTMVIKQSKTPGPYADDAAAQAKGVAVGQQYYQSTGAVVVRLT